MIQPAARISMRDVRWHPEPAPGVEPPALRGIRLEFAAGELTVLLGAPEDGGPALLRLLAGLERPDGGAIDVAGRDLALASEAELAAHRRTLGLALGDPRATLLPAADALTNVELALRLQGMAPREARVAAETVLRQFDLPADRRPVQALSAAQLRRLALATAIAARPALLLLEEPTRDLDALGADDAWQLLRDHAARASADGGPGATVIVATSDDALAARAPRVIVMRGGRAIAERVRTVAFARGGGDRFEEYALVGSDGTLTLPAEVMRTAGIGDRLQVVAREDRIELQREREPTPARERPWRPRPRA